MSPGTILASLCEHAVEFVVIGGLAAIAHGSRRMTRDIDIVVMPDDQNLSRLERALASLHGLVLREGGRSAPIDPADIAMVALGTTLHTSTDAGRLDVVGAPAGAAPFQELRVRAILVQVEGVKVPVAGLDDLIAMKRAAGRPLDLQDIADLTSAQGQPPARLP
jgi:hypothetical protein